MQALMAAYRVTAPMTPRPPRQALRRGATPPLQSKCNQEPRIVQLHKCSSRLTPTEFQSSRAARGHRQLQYRSKIVFNEKIHFVRAALKILYEC